MKVFAVFAVFFALASSQPPRCASPKQMEGIAVILDPEKGFFTDNFISYDYTNQKLRNLVSIYNFSTPTVKHFEEIIDYDKKIMYVVDLDKKTCLESPPTGPFQPIEVPATAEYVEEVYIGIEGVLEAGFSTDLWVGTTPIGRYAGLWSQVECIPIMASLNYLSLQNYLHLTVYNVTLGIKDRSVFTPPSYCK